MSAIEELKGQTLVSVSGAHVGSERICFETESGSIYAMLHHQDCCEIVTLNEIVGDVGDLIGSPILEAEETSNQDDKPSDHADSWTWTFYKLGTIRGHVTLRWLGESNGYYSEAVWFERLQPTVS